MTTRAVTQQRHLPLHILGGGSIGLLFASYIRRAIPNYPIQVLLRPANNRTIENETTSTIGDHHGWKKGGDKVKQHSCQILVSLCTPNSSLNSSFSSSNAGKTENDNSEIELIHIPSVEITSPSIASSSAEIRTTSTNTNSESKNKNRNVYDLGYDEKIKNLILCTKATDAASALQSIMPLLHQKCSIVILTNGQLAVRDEISQLLLQQQQEKKLHDQMSSNHKKEEKNLDLFLSGGEPIGQRRIILASTTHGAKRTILPSPGSNDNDDILHNRHYHIKHAGGGPTSVHDPYLADLFQKIGLGGTYVPTLYQMMYELWKKLAVNCVINPLSALLNCKNGDLVLLMRDDMEKREKLLSRFKDESGRFLLFLNSNSRDYVQDILKEVLSVANAELLTLLPPTESSNDNDNGMDIMGYDELRSFVHQVMIDTKDNTSSMLQDVNAGRYPTEVEYLNGYVCKVGKERYGVDCKMNRELCSMVDVLSKEKLRKS